MVDFLKSEANVITKSVATGASFALVDKFVLMESKAFDRNLLNKSLVSAGSDFLAGTLVDNISGLAIGGAGGEALQVLTDPVLSGTAYALISGMLKMDNRPFMNKVLHQAGASVVGAQLERPIQKLIG